MTRNTLLKITNMLLGVSFLFVSGTGLGMFFHVIRGSEVLFEVHEIAGVCFIIVGIMHVSLNWGWMKANFFTKKKKY